MPSRRFGLMAGVYIVAVLTTATDGADYKRQRQSHVTVRYRGLLRDYARAIARTVSTARQVSVDEFGFGMPDEIAVMAEVDASQPRLLYTDGADRIYLRVRSPQALREPSRSGTYHIYALCREVARLGLYRRLEDYRWMTPAATEGWTHYMGSVLVDRLYARLGRRLWPDRYEYLADGTQRLKAQLAARPVSSLVEAAGRWRQLAERMPRRRFAGLFRAMDEARPVPADPGRAVLDILNRTLTDQAAATAWWSQAGQALFVGPGAPGDQAETIEPKRLSGSLLILRHDNNKSGGRRHLENGGYAVRFHAPAGPWYLTGVHVHVSRAVSRRGAPQDATIRLLEGEKNVVAEFKMPYTCFGRREPQWIQMPVPPTRPPRDFVVWVALSGTKDDAHYVHYDRTAKGHSMIGLPGGRWQALAQGEWMIRAELDRPMEADPLADPAYRAPTTQPMVPTQPAPARSGKRQVKIKLRGRSGRLLNQ